MNRVMKIRCNPSGDGAARGGGRGGGGTDSSNPVT